ncbi:aldehyde dehydrogenase family protein [Amycolatopsis anabasis]|uniref:aldehyde dehydrogenase family protein n=1 Tax=Amycolatopsis anabasis TaxID=1840409 RepID=UPI001C5539D5|nr:aldehyde dehydrogenase family protein [Amycolatopsis anabasis]
MLELGGADPFILLSTDDLYDAFLEKVTLTLGQLKPSSPTAEDTVIGPVSSVGAAVGLEDQLRRAVGGGARVVLGGKRDGPSSSRPS